MKYYLVNYLILDNRTVTKNENLGISLHTFADIGELKKSIAFIKNVGSGTDNIVIKSYKQISQDTYNSLGTVMG